MKKKLALLLALVMILSLVPMSAFADAAPSHFASSFSVNKEEVSVSSNGDEYIKVTVYVANDDNTPADGATVYLVGNRGTAEKVLDKDGNPLADATRKTDPNGEVVFRVHSAIAGTAKLAVALGSTGVGTHAEKEAEIQAYLYGGSTAPSSNVVRLIGTKDVRFAAASVDKVEVANGALASKVANGIAYHTLQFRVVSTANAPVSGQEVTVSSNKTGVTFNKTSATTNAAGIAEFKVYSTKTGTFTIEAKAGSKSKTQDVVFVAGTAFSVERNSDDNEVIARDSTFSAKFKLTDVSGSWVKVDNGPHNAAKLKDDWNVEELKVVTEPTDSSITLSGEGNADGYLVVKTSELKKDGDYKLRVALTNGKTAEVNFSVKKQGDVTRITIEYDSTSLKLGAVSGTPTVYRYDANNVKKKFTEDFSANKFNLFVDNPLVITSVNQTTGALTATSNRDDIGSAVVTLVDTDNKLTTTVQVTVGGNVAGFTTTPPADKVNVNETAKITVKLVDTKGNPVALSAADTDVALAASYVISKPDGSLVTVEPGKDFAKDLKNKGVATVEVVSTKAGEVKVQLVIEYKEDGATLKQFTNNATVVFGTPAAPKPVYGAKELVLTIGSSVGVADGKVVTSDLAAFIKDGRTFVPVRFIAEQLGAEVSFTTNAEGRTETVTLTTPALTVTITMGSSSIVVVKDGVSSTVTADVAAFVDAASGRTVLPFRALAEAMGAQVSFGPEGGVVEWVKFVQ